MTGHPDATLATSSHCAKPKGKTMHRRLFKTLLTVACAAVPLALVPAGAAHAQSVMRPANDLVLSIGRGQLVSVPGSMTDIFVANEAIADVQIKSTRQLYIFGKSGGETTVYASNASGDVIWSANVRVGSNLESVDQMLHLAMPDAKVGVSTMGTNTFLLTGTVGAPEDAAEAERLVQAYVGAGANVISRLRTATPLQVNLQVRIAEVSRSLVKEIGTNLLTRDNTGGFVFGMSRGRPFGTIDPLNTAGLPRLDASSLYGLPKGTFSLPFDPKTGQFIMGGTQYAFNGNNSGQTALNFAGKLAGLDLSSALDLGERSGALARRREARLAREVLELATGMLMRRLMAAAGSGAFSAVCERVLAGQETVDAAARRVIDLVGRPKT